MVEQMIEQKWLEVCNKLLEAGNQKAEAALKEGRLNSTLPKSTAMLEPTLSTAIANIEAEDAKPTRSEAKRIAGEKMISALAVKYPEFDTNHNGKIDYTSTLEKDCKFNTYDEVTPLLKAMFNQDGKNGVNLMEANIAVGELKKLADKALGKEGVAYRADDYVPAGNITPVRMTAEIAYEVQSLLGDKQFPKVRLKEAFDHIGFKPAPKTPSEAVPPSGASLKK